MAANSASRGISSPERAARAVQPEEARGLTETYVLKVDENAFTARIVNGSLDVSPLAGRLGSLRAPASSPRTTRHLVASNSRSDDPSRLIVRTTRRRIIVACLMRAYGQRAWRTFQFLLRPSARTSCTAADSTTVFRFVVSAFHI